MIASRQVDLFETFNRGVIEEPGLDAHADDSHVCFLSDSIYRFREFFVSYAKQTPCSTDCPLCDPHAASAE
jgi:hypothetical protein